MTDLAQSVATRRIRVLVGGGTIVARFEGGVDPHLERFTPHGATQAAGDVEGVERNDAALFRLDDEDARIVARLGHRKHAPGVTGQQVLGAETAERPAGAEIGVGQASPF